MAPEIIISQYTWEYYIAESVFIDALGWRVVSLLKRNVFEQEIIDLVVLSVMILLFILVLVLFSSAIADI